MRIQKNLAIALLTTVMGGLAAPQAVAQNSLLPLLSLTQENAEVLEDLLKVNPGLDSALVTLRAQRVCRNIKFQPDEVTYAVALFTASMSPTLRTNAEPSPSRVQREHENGLTKYEAVFENLRLSRLNCFELEFKVDQVHAALAQWGQPLAVRLETLLDRMPASREPTQSGPITNLIVQEAPRRPLLQLLLPWNW